MAPAARTSIASLLALASILSAGAVNAAPGGAAPQGAVPDPQLCAEYLRDLAAYRRMAVLLGCELPQSNDATLGSDEAQFPPVVTDEGASSQAQFPPVVASQNSSVDTGSAAGDGRTGFPPVEEASAAAEVADPSSADWPPVVSEHSHASSRGARGQSGRTSRKGSSAFPPVVSEDADGRVDAPVDTARAAIEERLILLKEEAKARIRDAIAEKIERVKDRVEEKIKHKLEDAHAHHHHHGEESKLRRAAKDALKRRIDGLHHHGGLLGKLAQRQRR